MANSIKVTGKEKLEEEYKRLVDGKNDLLVGTDITNLCRLT
jgi:hypothetical protein